MTPLAPIYLLAAAAAGIPLVLHLIHRRKAQKVLFSTIRFLRLSNERTAHRRRIQDLLLLLLRALVLLLLALALAQFVIRLTEGSDVGTARASAVIIVDNSYSMATEHEGQARYDVAKEAALAILRQLRPDDEALALFTSGPERQQEPAFTRDNQEVQNTINRSRASAEGGNVMFALREAQDLLLQRKTKLKEIYILTDLQKRAWETGPKWDADAPEDEPFQRDQKAEIPIIVYDTGRPPANNQAVREVRVSGHAFVRGTPVVIDAEIYNPTAQEAVASPRLLVAGKAKDKRTVTLGPNGTATVSFAYQLPQSGFTHVQVSLPKDALAADNQRSVKLEVKDKIRALIVQDAASAVDFLDRSYFLERALDPAISLGGVSDSIIQPHRTMLRDLDRARLRDYSVVFLLGVKTLTDDQAAALHAFVKDGGGLILFAGEGMDTERYIHLFARGEDPLLPLPLLPVSELPPDRRHPKRVTATDEEHFVFAPFRGLNVFKSARVYKSARIDLHKSTPMLPLAHLEDGQPLALEHTAGRGKVVFLCVSADAAWSNLPVTPVFLPLIHQLCYHVRGSFEDPDALAVGAPYRFSFPEHATPVAITIRRPDGVKTTTETDPEREKNETVYTDTFQPGYYEYWCTTEDRDIRSGAFVVNPDAAESDMERIDQDQLEEHLQPAHVQVCSSIEAVETLVTSNRKDRHLRQLFILVTIIAAVFETVISNWVTPRSAAKRRLPLLAAEEGSDGA